MTKLTLSAAARAVGISRSTLHDHINTGKVSVQIDGRGRRTVDTSELLRAYGSLQRAPDSSAGQIRTGADTSAGHELAGRVAVLKAENQGLEALLQEKDAPIEELRHSVRLLEHKRVEVTTPMPMEPKARPARPVASQPSASRPDRGPMIIAGGVALLVELAVVLQSLKIIRLG